MILASGSPKWLRFFESLGLAPYSFQLCFVNTACSRYLQVLSWPKAGCWMISKEDEDPSKELLALSGFCFLEVLALMSFFWGGDDAGGETVSSLSRPLSLNLSLPLEKLNFFVTLLFASISCCKLAKMDVVVWLSRLP